MVRIDHRYEVFCNGQLLAEGRSTLACVDRNGRPQVLPDFLREEGVPAPGSPKPADPSG
jgi:acyl-CoA thioester hydrolase